MCSIVYYFTSKICFDTAENEPSNVHILTSPRIQNQNDVSTSSYLTACGPLGCARELRQTQVQVSYGHLDHLNGIRIRFLAEHVHHRTHLDARARDPRLVETRRQGAEELRSEADREETEFQRGYAY